ncbi:MAG: LytTR family DNA-binding domain-containing protein [Panacibacter sp.]
MIRTIIVDDEQHCIDRLSGLLAQHCSSTIHLMDVFKTVEDGLNAIKKLQPDLVFLDVQIHDKTGFDLLKQLDEINFEVIFTTAHEKYAVQAFKFSAIDFLLKPVDADDLKQSVSKLTEKISKEESSKKMEVLFHNLKNMQGVSKRICVPVMTGLVFLQVNDIIRCESDINYTTIFLKDKQKLLVAKTLKEFEEMLTDYQFFRVHNSHLINLSYVKSYNKGKGGSVSMTDNSEIEVSTRRKDEFLKKLTEM